MRNIKAVLPVLLILFLLIPAGALSQESGSCAEKLQTARALFEKGQVEQVYGYIDECLKEGFSKEEALEAYKLHIQAFLLEDRPELADSTMFEFLRKNPEYKISPTDHSSFVSLFNNYYSKVIVQASVHVGSNTPFITITESRSVSGTPGTKNYSTKPLNFFISGEVKYKLTNKIEVNAEIAYSQFSFLNSENILGFGENSYKETQRRIELPLSATYDITKMGNFTPYARLGFGPAMTMNASAVASFKTSDRNFPYDHTESDEKLNDSRIFLDVFAQAGAGIKIKIPGGFFLVEARANVGFVNQAVSGRLRSNQDLPWYYFHTDDSFRANMLNINIGYTKIFYKPVRREVKNEN